MSGVRTAAIAAEQPFIAVKQGTVPDPLLPVMFQKTGLWRTLLVNQEQSSAASRKLARSYQQFVQTCIVLAIWGHGLQSDHVPRVMRYLCP
jgi:hypothetical protein